MKHLKKVYWVSTVLFSLMILMGVGQYFFNTDTVREAFAALGYPTYLVLPLGAAKLAGVIIILWNKQNLLREWAYAGFFFVLVLGAAAHAVSGVPSPWGALVVLLLLIVSYLSDKKLTKKVDKAPAK